MTQTGPVSVNREVLAAMGGQYKTAYIDDRDAYRNRISEDPADVEALLGLADTNILIFVFGYLAREETFPEAKAAVERAVELDPANAEVSRLSGIISFLDWEWKAAEISFRETIRRDAANLGARHWYSLYLVAMGRFDDAMAQSDEMMKLDPDENYLVGRGSLFYFQHRVAELKELMHRTIEKDPTVPWGYDWLGMAYNGLAEHDDALRVYQTAFELSDGTAEVGAGFGHALGPAGEVALAKQMADYYASIADDQYVPPVQRAYIHIGMGEYDEAIRLLEQAYSERSWFLIFMKVEPWLDPLRDDPRFADIQRRLDFPV